MEWWSNSIADLGMRNADCGLQIEISNLQIFLIRNWEPARRVGVRRTNLKVAGVSCQ
jgi:hypothetical protein